MSIVPGTVPSVLHVLSNEIFAVALVNILTHILTLRKQKYTLFKWARIHTIKCNSENHNIVLSDQVP